MRKNLTIILSFLCVIFLCVSMAGCDNNQGSQDGTKAKALINGGFESADLSGWTIEYGDAFDDDCISSQKTFMFNNDANNNVLSINQTGNWYLTGKGYHGKYSGARTGAIRSNTFTLTEDGMISLKLAGGALTVGRERVRLRKPRKSFAS